MRDHPRSIVPVGTVEPAPRRLRGVVGGVTVFDTVRARYAWEIPHYPQYYVPLADVLPSALVDEGVVEPWTFGTARRHGLRAGSVVRAGCARLMGDDVPPGLAGTVRFDWASVDEWYEEDERVFVHPRSPYVRVDALRSSRSVVVSLDGVVLASCASPIMVFETGLPTRYYLDRTCVSFSALEPSDTVTACPYKGTTSAYWSVRAGGTLHRDLAWSYDFPTAPLLPVAGLVAFYNEHVDIEVDGVPLEGPDPVRD